MTSLATTSDEPVRAAPTSLGGRLHARPWIVAAALALAIAVLFWSRLLGIFFVAAALMTIAERRLARRWAGAVVVVRDREDIEVELGTYVDVRVEVRTNGPMIPWAYVDDVFDAPFDTGGDLRAWSSITQRRPVVCHYSLRATRRGLYRLGPTLVQTGGPLGLVESTRIDDAAQFLLVMPPVIDLTMPGQGNQPIHGTPRRMALLEEPARPVGVRAYRAGDELRRIHWRASARMGSLQSRVFERVALSGLTLAVEMASEAFVRPPRPGAERDEIAEAIPRTLAEEGLDVGAIELAVVTALAVGSYVLESGMSVGMLSNGTDAAARFPQFSGERFARPEDALRAVIDHRASAVRPAFVIPAERGREHQRALHVACARLAHQSGPALDAVLMGELGRVPPHHVLAVVTPRLDARMGGAIAAARALGLDVAVLWITDRARPDQLAAMAMADVPVFAIGSVRDLRDLAGVVL